MPRCGCGWCVEVRRADRILRPKWWTRIGMPSEKAFDMAWEVMKEKDLTSKSPRLRLLS